MPICREHWGALTLGEGHSVYVKALLHVVLVSGEC